MCATCKESSDISESEDGFLFRVALSDIEKHEKFKCGVQEDEAITIHGATSTGGKKVHSHNMVFDMHTENLWPLGDLSVFYSWPALVDPTTLEHMVDNGVLKGLSRRNRSNMHWTDQVPIVVAPPNSVLYMGPPFDLSGHNAPLNHPTTVHLPESTTVEELIRPLIGSFDVSDSDGGFLFCVTLPGVEKNEKFKCDVQEDETITIHGAMSTESLCPPGDLSVSYSWPAHVDPTTLEHVLDNGVLEGLSRRNRSNMDWADQAPISVAPLNSVPYTGPPFDSSENQPLNHTTMVVLDESTTVEELNQILSIKGFTIEGGAASDLLRPLIGAFDISDNDDGFVFRIALPGVEKNEKFKCAIGTVKIDGSSSTGGKTVHSHNMVFDTHTQNLGSTVRLLNFLQVAFACGPNNVGAGVGQRGFLKAL